jgi:competence ComEA-like helix-hairpin-helix protein
LLLAWAFLVQVLAVRALAGGLLVPESTLSLSPCRIDLNRASVFELQVLPSVGPSRAEALILERVRRGPFRGLVDLQRIHGFGPKTVAGLANFVVF